MKMAQKEKALPVREIVFASNERAMNAHRDLYHFTEDAYIIADADLLELVTTFSRDINKLHIAATWIDAIRLATWKADPKIGDVFVLLREAGMKTEELLPFRGSEIEDIFPYLYYGKRFDVLRKICSIAEKNSKNHLRNKNVKIHCHLISEDVRCIIASSL